MKEEVRITVGDVQYLLIEHEENFLTFEDDGPVLALVYLTKPGQHITRSALPDFRATFLEKDDVFISEFYDNVVFYSNGKDHLQIEPDAIKELAAWNTKTRKFLPGNPEVNLAPGPYVFTRRRTWQPWRIYHDFNGTFMCTFKPSSTGSGK
ncbi:hypothetical protein BJ875DRAFT_512431 [Amylocarpus encephaloides]|uniref:Scytalone dehydratase-like protein Arp1 N-terminal domain-containing protein n=1 Tax=Amylocarpus encephaloides TaxID=45428 RepID=A0A9P7YG93_9HELO|nr:hypothetical protein BJ875DRAFT_512431 [Amylocarpus encephaloides]